MFDTFLVSIQLLFDIMSLSQELGYNAWYIREALIRANIYLDRKVLSNFALFEPRTFRYAVFSHCELGLDRSYICWRLR